MSVKYKFRGVDSSSRSVVTLPNRVVSVWFTTVALFLAMMQRARSRSRSHSRAENGLSPLQFADSAMKADRDVVIAAVQWNGHALQYAAPALKADREVVMAAVTSSTVMVNVQSVQRSSDGMVRVTSRTRGGTTDVINIDARVANTTAALRASLAAARGVSAAAVSILLPSGQVGTIGPEHEGRL